MNPTSLIIILLFLITFIPFPDNLLESKQTFSFNKIRNEGYTAFIVNEDAPKDEKDEDDDSNFKCECQGTEVITHGDGHKTPCPCLGKDGGVCACGSKSKKLEIKPDTELEKDTSQAELTKDTPQQPNVQPVKTKAEQIKEDIKKKYKYVVYHMGADWCAPCNMLKKNVWPNKGVQKFFTDNKFKLYIFESQIPEHVKYFDYFQDYIEAYPTILVFKSDDLSKPIRTYSGYVNAEEMLLMLDKLKQELK